jgi:DNA-binding NarL/FixJ family response regulator
MYSPIRIILADDHEIFRNGFKLLLRNQKEIELIGEAENGKQLLELVDRHHPDLVITDIKMPIMDGIQASKTLKQKYPRIGIIALSMFNDDYLVLEMLEAGASGYLLKNTNKEELLQAVKAVHQGRTYYCNETSKKLTYLLSKSNFNPYHNHNIQLTDREKEIVVLICKELSNKEIATALDLKVRTIESHREKIQEKIGSRNMVGVVLFAIKTGLFKLEENQVR